MENRIVVDPVTRIEGHLRMEAVASDGIISDAFSTGTMVRGIEIIVKDRDPRDVWAFVMRVCGVCTSMHGLASVRAVENALDITVPHNAEMVRNIMLGVILCQDHVTHFYQLNAFDWVDVISALKADPKQTSVIAQSIAPFSSAFEPWGQNSPGYFADVQRRMKDFLRASPTNNIFSPTRWCWGSSLYKLPSEVNLIGLGHYMNALEFQKEIVKAQTVFGGKNPHPNYLVGGMACAINTNDSNALNLERLSLVKQRLLDAREFIYRVYLPDVLAILAFYPEWTHIGGGLSSYLSYGDFPMSHYGDTDSYLIGRGIVRNRDLSHIDEFDAESLDGLQEFVNNAWYKYSVGKNTGLHPSVGETIIDYTGPTKSFDWLDPSEPYSWIKTPRYHGEAMEVGPLARCIVNYAAHNERYVEATDRAIAMLSGLANRFGSSHIDISTASLFSTAGRILARAIDASIAVECAIDSYNSLIANIKNGDERMFNGIKWNPSTWERKCSGYSLSEAPRGALAHYIDIQDKRTANYQMVVPTTWNASPRDPNGVRSAFEASVIGTPVYGFASDSPEMALSIIRTLHSFDPCMACAVHLFDGSGSNDIIC